MSGLFQLYDFHILKNIKLIKFVYEFVKFYL